MIIPRFDIFKNPQTHLFSCNELVAVNQFGLNVLKKLSATALSQQFPLRLMLCRIFKAFLNSIIFLRSSLNMAFPLPEKADSPFSRNYFRQRYNKKGSIPNSCASSETFLRSLLNFTAFSLNAFS